MRQEIWGVDLIPLLSGLCCWATCGLRSHLLVAQPQGSPHQSPCDHSVDKRSPDAATPTWGGEEGSPEPCSAWAGQPSCRLSESGC